MYVFTANAFPYGAFKGERVKEQVYEPDWRTDERAAYTMRVADVLAALAPPDIQPSIQSPPLGYKPRVTGPDVVESYTRQLHGVVAYLAELEARTGRTVTLAIEPEPSCYIELTSELIDYFTNHLYSAASVKALAQRTGRSEAACDALLHKHLGAVYDICHQAVEYETIADLLGNLRKAGVPVLKLQPASALRIPKMTREIAEALRAFDDPIYLHQTIERYEGRLSHYLDLPAALAAWEKIRSPASGGSISTSRSSSRTSTSSRRPAPPSRRRSGSTKPIRSRRTSRSRLTHGTYCRRNSKPATSSTTSFANSSGCAPS